MKQTHALAPGTRVRNADGIIGAVEQTEYRTTKNGKQPSKVLIASEDGRWRYSIPIKLVEHVARNDNQDTAYVTVPSGELPRYILEDKQTQQSGAPRSAMIAGDTTLRIPLAVEELEVGTRPIQRGTIHLHKSVASSEQSFTVPTMQEQIIVEHIAADQFHEENITDPDDIIIPIMEERLVVHKELVVTEYIRVHKERVTQQQEVRDTVRHEILTIRQEHYDESDTGVPLLHMVAEKRNDTPTPA